MLTVLAEMFIGGQLVDTTDRAGSRLHLFLLQTEFNPKAGIWLCLKILTELC
mgnify:CR=1 FL=1